MTPKAINANKKISHRFSDLFVGLEVLSIDITY